MTALRGRAPLVWVAERHSLGVEAFGVLALYGLYEATRGLIVGDRASAVQHAHDVASLERSLHVFVEGQVQDAAGSLPGLIGTLGMLYLTLHLTVTGAYLLWLHRRRPAAFALVRTSLLLATALALIGYLAFPTAPPRDAALGISDTISSGRVDLNHGLINSRTTRSPPFRACTSATRSSSGRASSCTADDGGSACWARLSGSRLFVVVATGNHFLLDAAAGTAVAGVGGVLAYVALHAAGRIKSNGKRPLL